MAICKERPFLCLENYVAFCKRVHYRPVCCNNEQIWQMYTDSKKTDSSSARVSRNLTLKITIMCTAQLHMQRHKDAHPAHVDDRQSNNQQITLFFSNQCILFVDQLMLMMGKPTNTPPIDFRRCFLSMAHTAIWTYFRNLDNGLLKKARFV